MIILIVISHKCKVNPDNIATPIAAALGDLTTLTILASIGGFLYRIIGNVRFSIQVNKMKYLDNFIWLPVLTTFLFLILIPIFVVITSRNEYVNDVLIHGW